MRRRSGWRSLWMKLDAPQRASCQQNAPLMGVFKELCVSINLYDIEVLRCEYIDKPH